MCASCVLCLILPSPSPSPSPNPNPNPNPTPTLHPTQESALEAELYDRKTALQQEQEKVKASTAEHQKALSQVNQMYDALTKVKTSEANARAQVCVNV